MNRPREYYRKMRAKHIRRKKNIVSHYSLFKDASYYKFDGMYSKGKIHCSCPLCSEKAYYGKHVKTLQEQRNEMTLSELYDDVQDSLLISA